MEFSFDDGMTDAELQSLQLLLRNLSIVFHLNKELQRRYAGYPDVNGNPIVHMPEDEEEERVDVLYGVPGEEGYLEYSCQLHEFVTFVDAQLQLRGKEVDLFDKFMDSNGLTDFLSSGLDDELHVTYWEDEDPVANYW